MSHEAPTSQLPDWWPYRDEPDFRAPARRAVSGACELSHIFPGRCDGPRCARNWPHIMGYTNAAGRPCMHSPGRPRRDSPRFERAVPPRAAGGAGGARSDADVTIRPCARCTERALAVKWHLPKGRSAPLTDEVDLFLLNNAARVARGLGAITLDDYRAESALRERRVRAAHVYRHAVMRERTAVACMQEAQQWVRQVDLNTALVESDLEGWQHSAESLGPTPARARPEMPAQAYDPWAALADAGDTLDLDDVHDVAQRALHSSRPPRRRRAQMSDARWRSASARWRSASARWRSASAAPSDVPESRPTPSARATTSCTRCKRRLGRREGFVCSKNEFMRSNFIRVS